MTENEVEDDSTSAFQPSDKEARYHLSSIVDSLHDSVVSVDLQGVISSWNKAAEKLYGYTAEQTIGKPLEMLLLPAEIKELISRIDLIKAGNEIQIFDTIRIKKGGQEINVEVQLSPVKNEEGSIIGLSTLARDVTEIRKIRVELEDTQSRLRLLSDMVPQIIWANDAQGKANYFNERWYEYSGKTFEQAEGPGWPVISHVDDHHAISAWRQSLTEARVFESEARLKRKDGAYVWHLLRNVPLKDEKGNVQGWYGTATDIDKLRKTEISLQVTTEKMRAVFEAAVDFAIIPQDMHGNITDWNSGAEKTLLYKRDEVIGSYIGLLFTPEDRAGDIPAIELNNAAAKGHSIDERWHLRKDGTRFFMSGVTTPIYLEDKIIGYVKIARDITDRKLTEEALFLSEQRKNVLLQSTQIGEWEWDIETDIILRSEHASLLLGLRPGEVNEPFNSFYSLIHEDDLSMVRQQIETALNGLNIFQAEFRVIRADSGQEIWVNAYGRVVAHHNERAARMIGVIYDISDRKLQEKQKDDFISVASHELKTPLTAISAYSELLEEILLESSEPGNAELVAQLNQQIDRLVGLIHSLLDVTNVAEGRIKISPQQFDLNQLIAEHVRELQLASPSHKIIWRPSGIALVHADRNRIGQVIANLISNAVKYSPAGKDVIISTEDELDGVRVKIRDFGSGINITDQARIFQRYYRVNSKDVLNKSGMGLGLYISSEIIKQHMGTIGVESISGEGSSFYFKLPYS